MPTFGQMIAGYVGGRRAGGPWRGAIAAFIPVAIFLAVTGMAHNGILTNEVSAIAGIPSFLAASVSTNVPVLAPYIEFITTYVTTFVASLSLTLQLGLNGYLVTVIFAYIGGVVSQQRRKEMGFARAGVPTVISVAPHQTVFGNAPSTPSGWYDTHPESLRSMRKIPVKPAGRPSSTKKAAVAKKQQSRSAKKKKAEHEKSSMTSKERERIGQKLAERALRNYR